MDRLKLYLYSECRVIPTNYYCSIYKKVLVNIICEIKRRYKDLNPYPYTNCNNKMQNKLNTPNANESDDILDSNNTELWAAKKAKVVVNEINTSFLNKI